MIIFIPAKKSLGGGGQEVILQQELAKPMFRLPSEATSPPAGEFSLTVNQSTNF